MANRKQINNVCKALTAEQADWIRTFTPQTGFDLWWLDELANKSMPFREFAARNAQRFTEWANDTSLRVSKIPA